MNLQVLIRVVMAFVSKTDISRKIPKYFKFVKKLTLNVSAIPIEKRRKKAAKIS